MTYPYELMLCCFKVKENGILQGSLERKKEELHERRVALAKEVRTTCWISYSMYLYMKRQVDFIIGSLCLDKISLFHPAENETYSNYRIA